MQKRRWIDLANQEKDTAEGESVRERERERERERDRQTDRETEREREREPQVSALNRANDNHGIGTSHSNQTPSIFPTSTVQFHTFT